MPSTVRVVGIDVGFTATGLASIELNTGAPSRVIASRCARTQPTKDKRAVRVADDDAERCAELAREVYAFLRKQQPQVVIVELPSGGAQGARANRAMGMATGMIAAVLTLTDYAAEWVTPQGAKKAATGRRDASKQDVERAVKGRFVWEEGTMPKTAAEREHVCDAAAAVMAAEHGALVQAMARVHAP